MHVRYGRQCWLPDCGVAAYARSLAPGLAREPLMRTNIILRSTTGLRKDPCPDSGSGRATPTLISIGGRAQQQFPTHHQFPAFHSMSESGIRRHTRVDDRL
jgi:hypothetical protein